MSGTNTSEDNTEKVPSIMNNVISVLQAFNRVRESEECAESTIENGTAERRDTDTSRDVDTTVG